MARPCSGQISQKLCEEKAIMYIIYLTKIDAINLVDSFLLLGVKRGELKKKVKATLDLS